MQSGNALLRLEALDDGEARERVLQHAGVALLLVGNALFRRRSLVPENHGDEDRQQGEADGDQGQKRTAPEHHDQRADKRDADLYRSLQASDKVLLDGVHVARERGDIEGAVLAGEGLNALFHQPVKDVFPILLHGLCPELGEEGPVQKPSQSEQHKRASGDEEERAEAPGAFPGDQVGDLLDEPGDHQLRRGGEQGREHGHCQIEFVLPEQFPDERAAQRLDFILIHDGPPALRRIFKERSALRC